MKSQIFVCCILALLTPEAVPAQSRTSVRSERETRWQVNVFGSGLSLPVASRTKVYNELGQNTRMEYWAIFRGTYGSVQWEYDPLGRAILTRSYDERQILTSSHSRVWDAAGLLVRETMRGGRGEIQWDISRTYNEGGQPLEERTLLSYSGRVNRQIWVYDDTGLLIRHEVIEGNRTHHIYRYSYDQAGRRLSEVGTDTNGTQLGRKEYRYDEEGNQTEELRFDESDRLEERRVQRYDENRRVTDLRVFDGRGVLQWCDRTIYDSLGRVSQEMPIRSFGSPDRIISTIYQGPPEELDAKYRTSRRGDEEKMFELTTWERTYFP